MEINIYNDKKTVEVWLTQTERDDPAVKESLKPMYQAYVSKKYTVAVFFSGAGDLYQQTSDLVCYNRKRLAEMEVEQEETQQGFGMSMGM